MIILFLLILGAVMGSFIGALVWRLKNNRNITTERSECEHCHHVLSAIDLIPIVSWLTLWGKCRYCGKKIGIQALLLELVTAILFVASFILWPGSLQSAAEIASFILWLVILVALTALFVYDLHYKLLLNVILFPAIGIAAFKLIFDALYAPEAFTVVVGAGWGIIVCSGFFGLLYLMSRGRWIGLGDVKFGVLMGLLLGMPGSLIALISSYYIAAVVILPLLAVKKLNSKSQVPFGPFLITATILSFFFANDVVSWYKGLIG